MDPKGLATTPVFEWGTTEDLSGAFTIPFAAKTGKGNQSISADLTNLSLNTDYYFRVVATNTAGIVTQGKTVKFRTLPNPLPIADAGPDQAVGPSPASGALIVTLDGSKSTDVAGGTITAYSWEQIGTPAVIITPSTSSKPTFIAPTSIPYPSLDLNFKLTVTSSRAGVGSPYTNTDTTKVTVKWGFLDDFSTETTIPGPSLPPPDANTTSYYTTVGGYTVQGFCSELPCNSAIPDEMGYDPAGQNAQALMSVNHGVKISHDFSPASSQGVFSMDIKPMQYFGEGGGFALYLGAGDSKNFYVIRNWTDDGVNIPSIEKWVGGSMVFKQAFTQFIGEGISSVLKVTFSPTRTIWEAFGGTVGVYDDPTPGGRSITVNTMEIDFFQQNTDFDNIRLQALP